MMMGASPPTFGHSPGLSNDWKLWSFAEAELRVNPPNVRVDNKASADETIVTVDSANRSVSPPGAQGRTMCGGERVSTEGTVGG
jgi:hypothetical protein